MDHVHINGELLTLWWRDVCKPNRTEQLCYICGVLYGCYEMTTTLPAYIRTYTDIYWNLVVVY